jgi:aspartate/methionine/tyrosine aminotransferase
MPTLSPLRARLRPSVLADLEDTSGPRVARGSDLIDLHVGDTYLEPPQAARLSTLVAQEGDSMALYRYARPEGSAALRQAIADDLNRRGRPFPDVSGEAHVLVGAGATHAIFCAAAAILSPGEEVILATPCWPVAPGVLRAVGARVVEVPLTSRLYAQPSLDVWGTLRDALTPSTRALFFASPNNPDGKVLATETLDAIARFASEEDLWVIADEVYADLTYERPHVSLASRPGMAERTLTAYSFSKSHGLAGLRVGYVVGPEAVVRVARGVAAHSTYSVPTISQNAAAAAVASGPRWAERAALLYRRSLAAVCEALEGAKVRYHPPEGGAFVFVDLAEALGDRRLTAFLERAAARGVVVAPGPCFGRHFRTHVRICFTSQPLPVLTEGLARVKAALGDLG